MEYPRKKQLLYCIRIMVISIPLKITRGGGCEVLAIRKGVTITVAGAVGVTVTL